MTTQQSFPQNKVILFGTIDQRRQTHRERERGAPPEPAIRRFRNASNGTDYAIDLQVAAPYGGSYQIGVEVGMVAGAEILADATAGQPIVVEGYLTRTREVDRRFRDFEEQMIEGIFYQDVMLQVERVRPHAESDPRGSGTNIWVEGTVIEPPVFLRHPEYPDIELARLTLKAWNRAVIDEVGLVRPGRPCEVTVIIPTDDTGAELLYRRGNQVRVRGVLERVAMRQNRDEVRARVAELEAGWQARREEIRALEQGAERALLVEGARFLRERERTERAARTMVLAVEVTPLGAASPLGRAEAAEDRVRYIQEVRAERERRSQERRARRRSNLAHEAAARADDGAQPDDPPARVVTRRPRRQAAEVSVEPVAKGDTAGEPPELVIVDGAAPEVALAPVEV